MYAFVVYAEYLHENLTVLTSVICGLHSWGGDGCFCLVWPGGWGAVTSRSSSWSRVGVAVLADVVWAFVGVAVPAWAGWGVGGSRLAVLGAWPGFSVFLAGSGGGG